jgi:hypothetical protein
MTFPPSLVFPVSMGKNLGAMRSRVVHAGDRVTVKVATVRERAALLLLAATVTASAATSSATATLLGPSGAHRRSRSRRTAT